MYKVAIEQTDANKITPVKGDTLESLAASQHCEPGTTWQRLALYNWGTTDPHEVNRALIELVGCSKVDEAAPEKSLIDPDLGTTQSLHVPKTWVPPVALPVEKTHTLKVRRRRPPPAAVLTKVDPWFIPATENCAIDWRIEGVKERADKVDYDIYASSYFKATPTVADRFVRFAYAAVDVPIWQKRAFTAFSERMSHAIADWKGESEATDGILKPRQGKKRHIDVACSPYTTLVRYYKVDADKDARVIFKTFWPRFKKVFKDKVDTVGIDGAPAGLKAKTDAALKAARELEAEVAKVKADIEEFAASCERASLRAHSAAKLAAKTVTELATAKTATDKAKTDTVTARSALSTLTTAKTNANSDPTNVGLATAKSTAQSDFTSKKSTAQASARDAQQKADKVNKTAQSLVQAAGLAKAAAARAATWATTAQTSGTAATTAATAAKTRADEAKSAANAEPKAPDALKDAAKKAAERIEAAKKLADELTAVASAAVTTSGTLRADSATAATAATSTAAAVKAYYTAADLADDTIRDDSTWLVKQNSATDAVTKHGTAKTRADTQKTNADTTLTGADTARLDEEKFARAVARLAEGVADVVKLADTTDDNVVFDASLEVKWKVEKTDKVKHGQLLIVDKDGKALFRKPLAAADLAKDTEKSCKPGDDDQAKYWLDDKTKLQLCLAGMPYRVQMQVHSDWDEEEGVALAAMHTEVRLWAHRNGGLHADPAEDASSLRFALAPWRPEKDPPAAGSNEWYRMKLAEAGYYPGPVNEIAAGGATEPFKVALKEFQRSFPREEATPFTRLDCTGTLNMPTQAVLARTDTADANHQQAVDVKTETQATADAADKAKTAVDKVVAEATLAQTAAGNAATLAGESVTLAQQAVGDAAAAATAARHAKQAVDSAVSADPQGAAQALSLAVNAAHAAAITANAAAQSTATASTKGNAAKDAGGTAFDESVKVQASAGALKTDTDDAAKKALAAQNKAVSEAAPSTVKTPVDNCKTQSTTTDTAAGTAKTKSTDAGTAITTARDKGVTAAGSAALGATDANTAKSDADALVSALANHPVAQAVVVAAQAETAAALAKSAADKTLQDLQAQKTAADQAKTAADAAKTEAENAQTSVGTLKDSAKTANDAAEVERAAKKVTKDEVDKVYRQCFPTFGNPQGRGDYTLDVATPLLGDKSSNLIVWLDDCHYYTNDNPPPSIPGLWMENYRSTMNIGDGRTTRDAETIPRPWIPVEVGLPLLGKGQSLECTGDPPAVTDEMRRAVGPIRIDWSFDELPPEVDTIQDAGTGHATSIAELARAVTLKSKTAAALVAASTAKSAAAPVATHADNAKTKVDDLETLANEAEVLAKQAAADIAAAKVAADKASTDAALAAVATASPQVRQQATQSVARAAVLAATAVLSARAAALKLTASKTTATELGSEAATTKTEIDTCILRVDELKPLHNASDIAAGIADSTGAVTTAIGEVTSELTTASEALVLAKTDAAMADTAATKCGTDATTAETAAGLARTHAEAFKTAADLAKGQADLGAWEATVAHAAIAASEAGAAKTAGDQTATDVTTLGATLADAKPKVVKVDTDAIEAKDSLDALQSKAQTADTEAESQRVARVAAGDAAADAVDPDLVGATGHRARSHVKHILGKDGYGAVADGKLYTNAPAQAGGVDNGGIRPAALADYYKAPFGLAREGSVRPWLAADDTTNKAIFTIAHDDLGQDAEHVHEKHLGKAGVYLNPSRMAGDGFRYRAQVSFWPAPGGAGHPNQESLLGRYAHPPSGHTAALRMWRKTSMRGYVPWMPAVIAGWEATVASMAAFYAATHVHLVHEGASTTTPQQYSGVGTGPNDLMPASEFTQLIDEKVGAQPGPFNGKAASYTAGYIWPYLDQNHWGIEGQTVDLDTFVDGLGDIENNSWDLYSMFLVHKLIEGSEKKLGHMRGHTIAEFKSSPALLCIEYICMVDKTHKFSEIANNPAGTETHTVGSQTINFSRLPSNTSCKVAGCTGKYKFSTSHQDEDGLPLCAIGQPIGGCWQYVPRYAETWAHEVGHHRHFQHAPSKGNSTDKAPGGMAVQHDSAANEFQAHEASTHSQGWDRWCLMSYDKKAPRYFCGKCVLKNRGWAVNTLTNPAGDVQDA